MPDFSNIEFNRANHLQRKALRVALVSVFGGNDRILTMFLDEELDIALRDVVEKGPFKAQIYELIDFLLRRGKLDALMGALYKNKEYQNAPALSDLVIAWESVSIERNSPGSPLAEKERPAAHPLERILDGEVARMKPVSLLSGIAALRRRVCLLHLKERPVATGFLIGPDLVVTTAYVIHPYFTNSVALQARFDFGIDANGMDDRSLLSLGTPLAIDPVDPANNLEVLLGSLDFAVLPLKERLGEQRLSDGTTRGWFDMTDTRERLRESEPLFMLHHPKGGPMMISEGGLGAPHSTTGRLAHSCPAVPGSGGAPLVDATLRLVGLNEMGKISTSGESSDYNTAVRADKIARKLVTYGIEITMPPRRGAESVKPKGST